ncbi:MFS transporter [Duganella sp. FT92W]|uniref:MFS transporter n=1 Tax=Pseudoduganella rivuli TaxID=2666085 RepID=A0A7X2IM60_9BURK|nr:MFS transporter [Pseudoduganella rivuli]MRV72399.1 MFS transporter [Pseudoduganella rivuli]
MTTHNTDEMDDTVPGGVATLIVTRGLSSIGATMFSFGLDIWIYRKTGSYAVFAYFAVLIALPNLVLAPIAGALVDRYNKKTILMACELVSIVAILLVALQHGRGVLDLYTVAVAIFMLSVVGSVRWIAMGVAISLLVPPRARDRVNTLQQSFEGGVMLTGPLLGTAVLTYFGLDTVIAADLASSLLAAASLAFIAAERFHLKEAQAKPRRHFWSEVTFGCRWIWGEPVLRRLLLFIVGYNFAAGLFTTTSTPYLLSFTSDKMLGASLAFEGGGALLVGGLLARWGRLLSPERRVVLAAASFGLLMLAWGLARRDTLVLVLSMAAGVLTTMLIAALQTTWQNRVPVAIQGKVFATRRMVSNALLPLSILISVPVSERMFMPLLQSWPGADALWGSGQTGALGMMLSIVGVALFVGCYFYHRHGGLYPVRHDKRISNLKSKESI